MNLDKCFPLPLQFFPDVFEHCRVFLHHRHDHCHYSLCVNIHRFLFFICHFAQSLTYFGYDLQIYIDELTDFSTATSMKPWLKSLFRKARKRKISIYWGSQRPAGVNKWAWDNSQHKLLFYIREYDRKVLDKYYKGISDQLAQVEWGSYQSIYLDPAGQPHLMERAK